jgi:hypothetical protein
MKMDTLLNCSVNGWGMTTGTALIFGVLGLSGAALVKYLLSGRNNAVRSATPISY